MQDLPGVDEFDKSNTNSVLFHYLGASPADGACSQLWPGFHEDPSRLPLLPELTDVQMESSAPGGSLEGSTIPSKASLVEGHGGGGGGGGGGGDGSEEGRNQEEPPLQGPTSKVDTTTESRQHRKLKGSVNPLVELPDDGYVWRKYGQKALNNTNIDRVYYWCAWRRESGCLARKWVDVACDDATHCLHVSIEGQHNHEERSAPKPRRGASHQRRVPWPDASTSASASAAATATGAAAAVGAGVPAGAGAGAPAAPVAHPSGPAAGGMGAGGAAGSATTGDMWPDANGGGAAQQQQQHAVLRISGGGGGGAAAAAAAVGGEDLAEEGRGSPSLLGSLHLAGSRPATAGGDADGLPHARAAGSGGERNRLLAASIAPWPVLGGGGGDRHNAAAEGRSRRRVAFEVGPVSSFLRGGLAGPEGGAGGPSGLQGAKGGGVRRLASGGALIGCERTTEWGQLEATGLGRASSAPSRLMLQLEELEEQEREQQQQQQQAGLMDLSQQDAAALLAAGLSAVHKQPHQLQHQHPHQQPQPEQVQGLARAQDGVQLTQAEFDQLASHYGLGPEEMGAREIGQVTAAGVPEGSLHGVPAGPAWGPAQLSAGEQQKKRAWGAGDSSDSGLPGSLLESLLPLFKRGRLNPQQQPVVLGERDKERAADVSTAMLDSAAGAGGGAMAVGGVAGAASVGTMLPQFDTQLFPNLNLFQRNPQQQQQQGPQKQLGQGTDDGLLAFGGTGAGGHLSGFHRQGDARYALLDALLASLRQDPPAVHQESRFSMPIPACPRADEISPRSDPPLLMQDSCHIKTTPGAAVLPASYFQGEGQSMPPAAQFDQMRRPGTFAPAGAGARGGALAAPGPHGEGLTVQPLVFNPHEFSFTGALPSPSVARALQLLEANMLAPLGALQSQAELMEPGGTRAASVAPGGAGVMLLKPWQPATSS